MKERRREGGRERLGEEEQSQVKRIHVHVHVMMCIIFVHLCKSSVELFTNFQQHIDIGGGSNIHMYMQRSSKNSG